MGYACTAWIQDGGIARQTLEAFSLIHFWLWTGLLRQGVCAKFGIILVESKIGEVFSVAFMYT